MQNNRRRSLCGGWRVIHYHLYPRRRHLGCPRERVMSNNNLTNRRRRRKNLTLYIRVKSRTGGETLRVTMIRGRSRRTQTRCGGETIKIRISILLKNTFAGTALDKYNVKRSFQTNRRGISLIKMRP